MNTLAARLLVLTAVFLLTFLTGARGQTPPVLTTFYDFTGGTDGAYLYGSVVQGNDGNFYGTTSSGGASSAGTVFQLTPAGVLTTLYTFSGGADGSFPQSSLVLGNDGNFYGTTVYGGRGDGTVYSVTPAGVLTTIHTFTGGADGSNPNSELRPVGDGSFYGVTGNTLYTITPAGGFKTVFNFSSHGDPNTPLRTQDGSFYGTTEEGGTGSPEGLIYHLTADGEFTVLRTFVGGSADGARPRGGLIVGPDGNFYGTTLDGGSGNGTVYSITPAGVFTLLHTFTGQGADGAVPFDTLTLGRDGNFYGTTFYGGTNGLGAVFAITPAGVFTPLHSFTDTGTEGYSPRGALVQGAGGNFYGTTYDGGPANKGTVFELSPAAASAGTVQFAATTVNTTESAGSVTLTVQRTGGSAGAVSVTCATSDGSALAGTDYTAAIGTLTWADGDMADKTVSIPILDRGLYDGGTKTFTVTLSSPTGGASLGSPVSASVNILDNDAAPVPTVVIASPIDGATFLVGASVPFAASVTDPGGILSTVTFSVNGAAVYQSTGRGPFVTKIDTTPFPTGDYVLAAAVVDGLGRTNTSSVTVHVVAATEGSNPPTVAVLTPLLDQNGQPRSLPAGTTITVAFTAASTNGAPLQRVSLYADGALVAAFDGDGTPLTSAADRPVRRAAAVPVVGAIFQTPYTLPGTDQIVNLVAVALDALGHSTVSDVASVHATITNDQAPVLTLSGLTSGTHLLVGQAATLLVSARDPDAAAGALAAGAGRQDAAGNATLAALEYYVNGVFDHAASAPPFDFTFTPPSAGKFVLQVVATDGAGLATLSAPVVVEADPAAVPTVSVAAAGTGVVVAGQGNGVLVVTRTGDPGQPLTVLYKVKGAAMAGVDYKKLPGTVTIPAGATKAKIKVKPLAGAVIDGTLKLKLVLVAPSDGSYTVGTSLAKIKLAGD